ncbi:MAG: hypothetical protein IJF92_04785 [Bacilli bacterium]|nr:hypothetical protein [Bacilli bacterium]
MSDYKDYVNSVNKIFDCVKIMKSKWDNPDNLNYLGKIEDYKSVVIEISRKLKQESKSSNNLEALDNDR